MEILISSVISLFIGLITSFSVWYFLYRKLVPEIEFSEKISKINSAQNNKNYDYRIKYRNIKKRAIIDVNIYIRLKIKGLFDDRKENNKIILIEADSEVKHCPIIRKTKKGGRLIVFNLNKTNLFSSLIFPENIRKKFKDKVLTLEDVLKLGTDTTFEIVLMGYDEFSGAKKVIVSKNYGLNDIEEKYFNFDTLEINETPTNKGLA